MMDEQSESVTDIGRALERTPGTIHAVVRRRGGVVPRQRCRRTSALSVIEREQISRRLAAGVSVRSIARELTRAASTISREITRNGGREAYRAQAAEERSERVACRPRARKLSRNTVLRDLVETKLKENWSPQQISRWLVVTYPDDESLRVSYQTIYLTLFVQARGARKRE